MLFIVLRKIFNNKWLIACLLAGSILAVAMVSSIPMYTDGILQRMLVKDMENYQLRMNTYPGKYLINANIISYYDPNDRSSTWKWFDNKIMGEAVLDTLPADCLSIIRRVSMQYQTVVEVDAESTEGVSDRMTASAFSDYKEHMKVVKGRYPVSGYAEDGAIEVLIQAATQADYGLILDKTYKMVDSSGNIDNYLLIRPVGIYEPASDNDAWWYNQFYTYADTIVIDYDFYVNTLMAENNGTTEADWCFQIDYTDIPIDSINNFLNVIKEHALWLQSYPGLTSKFLAQSIMENYFSREQELRTTLWVLQVPILMMLAFYIFMVAQMIVQNDDNEIAVLKSRGASKGQIFLNYLLQSSLLSGVSVILGPVLAIGICTVLGASNGFLEFVGRTALPIVIRPRMVYYALVAGVFSVVMMMIPAIVAARTSIVELKQKKARRWNAPIWQKMFLDFILLGVAFYGLYTYQNRQALLALSEAAGTEAPVDPLLFMISTFFILGAGLLFLRIYPYIIRFVFWLGRRAWSPVLYTSFIQVGRSGGREGFLMLFLVLTLSIGVFSANSARTINQNIEDRISYSIGADMTMQMEWLSNAPSESAAGSGPDAAQAASSSSSYQDVVIYQEPDFDIVEKIDGIEAAAKVLMPSEVSLTTEDNQKKRIALMAIEPDKFGQVCWSNSSLLPTHINNYLNLMTYSKNAVLISSAIADEMGVATGDTVKIAWASQDPMELVVFAVVDYWPGINPAEGYNKYFVIADLNYIQSMTMLEPYQVWMRRDDTTSTQEIYDSIEELGIRALWIHDTKQEIITAKNDPLLQGTNGAMTMGFVVTMAISMIGFIIYWVLSIRSRTLQFGILRAIGMTKGKVIGMIICEQVLISVVAIFMGLIIGGIACEQFVPLLEMVYSAADQVPPFHVVASRSDYLKIYAIIGIMLAAGVGILGALINKIKVAQAIKLGED